jgi:UDP-2-acetamido-3-amino-2,3-dideoxy-glucuronate N-acetyltransferase
MIHPLADVKSINIGKNTRIWQFAVVLENAVIGEDCNINCHTFIENDVVIGNKVTLKSGVYLWDGIRIEDNVFIGPNASFVNDPFPRSKKYPDAFQKTILQKGCSIGANATILGGVIIGEYALVGAGSVITRPVKPYALVMGNPGRQVGWVSPAGDKLVFRDDQWHDSFGNNYKEYNGELKPVI